ncbi:MAG TPA: hypothetical protein VEZ90_10660 [Blastocatellia bacterium]|nr:hypothetical protein [Blastocatellia bacterium]
MTDLEEKQVQSVLAEITRLSKEGVVPVTNEHLSRLAVLEDALNLLLLMRGEGLISGDLITSGQGGKTPHKLTNIRLTYMGLQKMRRTTSEVREQNRQIA